MNLLIGLVILLCLVCSELQAAEVASDLWTRLVWVALVTLTVPGLALFQTLVVSKRIRNTELLSQERESMLRRLSVCHSAVWLIASLAIIWAVRWQDVVRGNWGLDQWPVIDEAIILAPIIFSLVASWAIFYEIQQAIAGNSRRPSEAPKKRALAWQSWQSRMAYVSIRFRVYFLMILIPAAIAILAKDVAPWVESLNPQVRFSLYATIVLAMMAGFPFLLLLMWKTIRIENDSLKSELVKTCQLHRLHVHDILVWKTDGQIVNALVAGLIPRLRVIVMSDGLIKHFPRHELLAILRHEAGHVRLWHLPTRIGFTVLPLLALAIDERNAHGGIVHIDSMLEQFGLPRGSGLAFLMGLYAAYAVFGLSWLSHQMEFEADIYSCQQHGSDGPVRIDAKHVSDMSDALLRLAALNPEQIEKRSLLHPSIGSRMQMIRAIESHPQRAIAFGKSFLRRRRIIFIVLVSICAIAVLNLAK